MHPCAPWLHRVLLEAVGWKVVPGVPAVVRACPSQVLASLKLPSYVWAASRACHTTSLHQRILPGCSGMSAPLVFGIPLLPALAVCGRRHQQHFLAAGLRSACMAHQPFCIEASFPQRRPLPTPPSLFVPSHLSHGQCSWAVSVRLPEFLADLLTLLGCTHAPSCIYGPAALCSERHTCCPSLKP